MSVDDRTDQAEMIDRAARAMWEAGPTTARPSWDDISERQREFARHEVEAAARVLVEQQSREIAILSDQLGIVDREARRLRGQRGQLREALTEMESIGTRILARLKMGKRVEYGELSELNDYVAHAKAALGASPVEGEGERERLRKALREIAEAKNPTQWRHFAEWMQDHASAALAASPEPEGEEPTARQLADDTDGVVIQRDDLREKLDRVRAAAESDPDLPSALRDFLLRETRPGWLHVTPEMLDRQRKTGTHHAAAPSEPEGQRRVEQTCDRCGSSVLRCRCD